MFSTLASTLFVDCHFGLVPQTLDSFRFMAGTTGLEPATSAVTASHPTVTCWNQEARMATQSALSNPWQPLLHP